MSELNLLRFKRCVRLAKDLDSSVTGSTYIFAAAIVLYCTERIVDAIREGKVDEPR